MLLSYARRTVTYALVLGVTATALPGTATAEPPAGVRITGIHTPWCDLDPSARALVSVDNKRTESIYVGLFDQRGTPLYPQWDPPLVEPGRGRLLAAVYPGWSDTIEAWSMVKKDSEFARIRLLDSIPAPTRIDCSDLDVTAALGEVQPGLCAIEALVDNRRSSGPIRASDWHVTTGKTIEAGTRSRLIIPLLDQSGAIPRPGGLPLSRAAVVAPDALGVDHPTKITEADVPMKCDGPLPTLHQAGVQAPVSTDRSVSARLVVPPAPDCATDAESFYRTSIGTTTDTRHVRTAALEVGCYDGVLGLSAVVEYGELFEREIDFRAVAVGDELQFSVDDGGAEVKNLTRSWTLRLDDPDPVAATGAGVATGSYSGKASVRRPVMEEVRFGDSGISSIHDLVLHWDTDPRGQPEIKALVGADDRLRFKSVTRPSRVSQH